MAYVLAGYWAAGYVENEPTQSLLQGGGWVWAMPYEEDPARAAKDAKLRAKDRQRWTDVEQAIYDAVREVELPRIEAVRAVAVPAKVKAAALRLMPDMGDAGRSASRLSDLMDAIWRDSLARAQEQAAQALAVRNDDDALILLMVA